MIATRLSDSLAGVLIGLVGGGIFFVLPALATLFLALFAALAFAQSGRARAWAGLPIGVGAAWLGLLSLAAYSCARFDAGPGQECAQPDVTPWLAAGALLAVVGIVGSVAAWRLR